jgi:hypothetical protein
MMCPATGQGRRNYNRSAGMMSAPGHSRRFTFCFMSKSRHSKPSLSANNGLMHRSNTACDCNGYSITSSAQGVTVGCRLPVSSARRPP